MLTPLVRAIAVVAPLPSLGDNTGDLDRLKKALVPHLAGFMPTVPYQRLAKVAGRFRAAGFKGFAIVNEVAGSPVLVDFFPEMPPVLAGMALDLGTTHLEATLPEPTWKTARSVTAPISSPESIMPPPARGWQSCTEQ